HLIDRNGRVRWWWLAIALWVPILAALVEELAIAPHVDSILLDPTMHARVLVTIPLLLVAEQMLEVRCGAAMDLVREEAIAERAGVDAILDRAERFRDSRLVELGFAIIVLALGQAALWDIGGWSGLFSGRARGLGIPVG